MNIIFGALYDSNKNGNCTITVIATGIEDSANAAAQSRLAGGFAYKTPTATPGFGTTVTPSVKPITPVPVAPTEPVVGINKPVDIQSTVKAKTLNIPDFLTRKQ